MIEVDVQPVENPSAHVGGPYLPVTLVVPLRDEEQSLPALLDSIDAQRGRPAQVVLVDAGSVDATPELARAQCARDARYTLMSAGGPATPGRARNLGVGAATQPWIAMTDAGITLDPGWLAALWQAHVDRPAAEVVYGSFEFDLRSFFEECAAVAYCDAKHGSPAGRMRGPAVVSCLVSRRAFDRVGGFIDSRSGEDEVFVRALRAAGVETWWAPDASVSWCLRPDLASTVERFRSYSYHYVRAGQQKHWHHPMALGYLPVAAGLVLAATRSPRWSGISAAVLVARVAARVRRHRRDDPTLRRPGPLRLSLVALVLVATDAATAWGWWQAARDTRTGQTAGS